MNKSVSALNCKGSPASDDASKKKTTTKTTTSSVLTPSCGAEVSLKPKAWQAEQEQVQKAGALPATTAPSKHAGSDSHPVRIRSKASARSWPDDSCTPPCFRAGSVWPKPYVTQYDPVRLWKNASESGSGKLVAARLRSSVQNLARWFLLLD